MAWRGGSLFGPCRLPTARRPRENEGVGSGFTTIGHSDRTLAEVIDMLRHAGVETLVDVRAFPRSRRNPAFNLETFPRELEIRQIGYEHLPDLGGRRPRQHAVDENCNALWRVQSFHNYADYALGEPFAQAFARLLEMGSGRKLALMCSEAVWWRCHRRIIVDYLLLGGHPVDHLMGGDRVEPARPTPGATRSPHGRVIYPSSSTAMTG